MPATFEMPEHLSLDYIPRLVLADAYTIGSGGSFESDEAEQRSVYYLTFRRGPSDLSQSGERPEEFNWIDENEQRMVFFGLSRILYDLFKDPVTTQEIEEAKDFLVNRKTTITGHRLGFHCPYGMWQRVVDEYNGYVPVKIEALPEGCVTYPGEPVIRVTAEDGFGPLAAWFESKLMHVWATTSRATLIALWRNYVLDEIIADQPDIDPGLAVALAEISCHDFGDRSAASAQESALLGEAHLIGMDGTDTFVGAFAAWRRNRETGNRGASVDALAHRIVQGFVDEGDAYRKIFDQAGPGELVSMVADCYDYKTAVRNHLVPLAIESRDQDRGVYVVARPDSGNALEQVIWTIDQMEENGLFTETPNGKVATTLRIIEGDGMRYSDMIRIKQAIRDRGWIPHGVIVFGVGGWLRNSITRDMFSTKYALCSVGNDDRPVLKVSNTPGKGTVQNALLTRHVGDEMRFDSDGRFITLHSLYDGESWGDDARVVYYDGTLVAGGQSPFPQSSPVWDTFDDIQQRAISDLSVMPLSGGGMDETFREQRDAIRAYYLEAAGIGVELIDGN